MADEGLPGRRLRLGSLALVVRIDEVGTPAVQIDGGTQLTQGESTALDVPARPPRSPDGVP